MPGAGGLLALPIALANVGLGLGLAIVILFGVVNMLTVAALAETVVRSGTSRFGLGFLGQLAQEYLGREATILLTITFAINNFFILVIFFLGVSGTLAGTTSIVAPLWMLPQFAITVYFLSRRSLNATITVTMLVALVSLGLVIAIPLLALPNLQPGNLDFQNATKTFSPATLGLIVGVMSTTFLSHFLVATYGPVVLPSDPSGRSWIRGSIAAIGVFILIACLWLVVTSGVLSTETLLKTTGTIISPLAERVGPIINILGTVLVILTLGLATIQVSFAQYFSVEERLPPRGSATWAGKLSETRRLLVAISPMLGVLILAEWLAVSGIGSFATLLGVFDVLVLPLLAGIIPVLLLAATRRKGDYSPGYTVRLLGRPAVLGLLYVFFVASIVVHGLYIWEAWPLRLLALGSTIAILIVTGMVWRGGLTKGRVVVELRHDQRLNGSSQFSIVGNGRPLLAAVKLIYTMREREYESPSEPIENFAALEAVVFQLPASPATQLKLWLHHLPPEGRSKSLPAHVVIEGNAERRDFDVNKTDGPLFIMEPSFPCSITITLIKD
jgi:tyrosine-specific transport protein